VFQLLCWRVVIACFVNGKLIHLKKKKVGLSIAFSSTLNSFNFCCEKRMKRKWISTSKKMKRLNLRNCSRDIVIYLEKG
jgi:hypothetical protein